MNSREHWLGERGNSIVFKISRKCPVGCDFCCDPKDLSKAQLSLQEMKSTLADLQKHIPGRVEILAFTGGDAFVHYKEMLEVIEYGRSVGISKANVITSAFWAKTEDKAYRMLLKLKEAGLTGFSLSCDPGHQRLVPLENVRNALHAADSLGLTGFVVGTFESTDDKVENYLGEPPDTGNFKFVSKVIAPFGWAASRDISVETYGLDAKIKDWGCYRQFGHDILIQPNGDVLPCCSTSNTVNPLIYGNVRRDSIVEIVERVTGSFLLRVLKHHGFGMLKEMVIKHFPDAEWPNASVAAGPCSYCVMVFQDKTLSRQIVHALRLEEPEYVRAFIMDNVADPSMAEIAAKTVALH